MPQFPKTHALIPSQLHTDFIKKLITKKSVSELGLLSKTCPFQEPQAYSSSIFFSRKSNKFTTSDLAKLIDRMSESI